MKSPINPKEFYVIFFYMGLFMIVGGVMLAHSSADEDMRRFWNIIICLGVGELLRARKCKNFISYYLTGFPKPKKSKIPPPFNTNLFLRLIVIVNLNDVLNTKVGINNDFSALTIVIGMILLGVFAIKLESFYLRKIPEFQNEKSDFFFRGNNAR